MKNVGKKGFTLVELLAVITIMGILMLVAIPAVSRTIENSRRDTFMDTAKAYINAIKNAVAADELYDESTPISALGEGFYYYGFQTDSGNTATDLMEQGGKSSWGNADVFGYIVIHKTVTPENPTTGEKGRTTYEYAIKLTDTQSRGISDLTKESALKRSSVKTSGNARSDIVMPSQVNYKGDGTIDIALPRKFDDNMMIIADESVQYTSSPSCTPRDGSAGCPYICRKLTLA